MKKYLLILLLVVSGCSTKPEEPNGNEKIKVGAFNIQIFGVSKMSKPHVVDILVKTVARYDLVLIQEIRDASGAVIVNFMEELNIATGNKYNYIVGPRLGRSTSKEQYAYIYNKNKISVEDSFTYDDVNDDFEREPMVTLFRNHVSGDYFFAIGIHVKPDDVVNELNKLDDVYYYAESYFNMNSSIIMGDFNADCSYLSVSAENNLDLKKNSIFNWHIDITQDTTLAVSECAYDRIITTGSITSKVKEVEIFNFKTFFGLSDAQGTEVSDHYPVGITVGF